ncbi:MAG: hypothetical protein WCG08_14350, partial [Paludibacter sp.]
RVLEELILNKPNTEIVFVNTILKQDEKVEEYISIPNTLRASDLILNPLPRTSILFKRTVFDEIGKFEDEYVQSAARLLAIKAILNNQKSYSQINMFFSVVKQLEEDTQEAQKAVSIQMPYYTEDIIELAKFRAFHASEKTKVLIKFGQSVLFKSIWTIRKFAEKRGFFELKAKIKQKQYYKQVNKNDKQKRLIIAQKIMLLPENLLTRKNDTSDVIVSLTSFGHRVNDSAPYAIYTLFTQKQLPNRIILFLDHDNWNSTNIPALLQKLQQSGLEIMFCEDIRPYKKLIPAMRLFPQNTIITVDDDVYYNDATLSELMEAYENSDKKSVICHWAYMAEQRNGKFVPVSKWKDSKYGNSQSFHFPVGQDGVLYPPQIFDEEMFKSDIFMKLCTNDDVWFWIQEYRCKVKVLLIQDSSKHKSSFVNTLDQWVPTKKSALLYLNVIEGRNDINLKNLLEYYKIN